MQPGAGCSEGFYQLRFLTIPTGVAEVKAGWEPRENKGNISLPCPTATLCSPAAPSCSPATETPSCPGSHSSTPWPPARGQSPQPHLVWATSGLNSHWILGCVKVAGMWSPPQLPANKRSKLGGAEPAGGIWQLTCHFVRHWSKLISLAESP